MARQISVTTTFCLWGMGLALGVASCGGSDNDVGPVTPPETGGSGATPATGGSGQGGGQGGDGAAPTTGGSTAGGSGGTGALPPGEPCCGGFGTCVGSDVLDAATMAKLGQDRCPTPDLVCGPNQFLAGNQGVPCRSVDNAEGRCGPLCIPEIGLQHEALPQDACDDSSRCAPCYHPADGEVTGICGLAGDAPVEPPYIFERCGSDRGGCVPAEAVPPERVDQVPQDSCPDGRLCAPLEVIKNPNHQFPVCHTDVVIFPNLEGRCVPKYVTDANPSGGSLNQGDCTNPDDICAPCNDPTMGNAPTGVCG